MQNYEGSTGLSNIEIDLKATFGSFRTTLMQ